MFRAIDKIKDQSYFLFATTQEELNFLRFPLGEFTKQQTRQYATDLGLHLQDKSDSQDICFVGGGQYQKFLDEVAQGEWNKGTDMRHGRGY